MSNSIGGLPVRSVRTKVIVKSDDQVRGGGASVPLRAITVPLNDKFDQHSIVSFYNDNDILVKEEMYSSSTFHSLNYIEGGANKLTPDYEIYRDEKGNVLATIYFNPEGTVNSGSIVRDGNIEKLTRKELKEFVKK